MICIKTCLDICAAICNDLGIVFAYLAALSCYMYGLFDCLPPSAAVCMVSLQFVAPFAISGLLYVNRVAQCAAACMVLCVCAAIEVVYANKYK